MSPNNVLWDDPAFNEGRIWGRKEEQARIIYELSRAIRDDEGEGLTELDEDGMRVVLNMNGLIRLIGGTL